ncbi:TRAFAC clade GTPase domain-containing protein [Streptomyces sp. NPDC001443]
MNVTTEDGPLSGVTSENADEHLAALFSGPWWASVLLVLLVLQTPVVVYNLLRSAPVAYVRFVASTGRAVGPWTSGAADPRLLPPGGAQPAYRSYWAGQAWVDVVVAARAGLVELWRRAVDVWVRDRLMRLWSPYRTPYQLRGSGEVFFRRTFVFGVAAGALLGTLAAAVTAVVTLVVFGTLAAAVCLGLTLAVLAVRGLDGARLTVGRIRMKCPHPGCYRSVALPVYRCPRCRAAHRALRPGGYGVLRRVCGCEQRLPTGFLTGRHRLDAECPVCSLPLPDGLGSARLVHVPLIGGTSAGKTMLVQAMVTGLFGRAAAGELSVRWARDEDRREYEHGASRLASGGVPAKTTAVLPTAVMLDVRGRRRRRLLYLYDPRGENIESAQRLREQEYLAHADAVLLVVDVLADPAVTARLTPDERGRAAGASPAGESPMDTYDRLTGELAAMSGRRRRTPVAVVVTKRDVLLDLGSLPTLDEDVAAWLRVVGLENLVRGLEHDFGASLFTSLSAWDAVGTSARAGERRRAAEPVLWLLGRSGLRPRKMRRPVASGRIPPRPTTDPGVAESS